MAIPVLNFPFLSGTDKYQKSFADSLLLPEQLMAAQLSNKILGPKAQYAEPLTRNELLASELKNRIDQIKANYAEPNAQEELKKLQQYNQYYAPNIQSEIGLRGAQTDKTRYDLAHPGLMAGGNAAQLEYLKGLGGKINPEQVQNLIKGLSQAPMADIAAKQAYAQTAQQNLLAKPFKALPKEYQDNYIATLKAAGYTDQEAGRAAINNRDLGSMLEAKGYKSDLSDLPTPQPVLTSAAKSALLRSNMAKAGLDAADDFINEGISHYAGQPTIQGSPLGFYKDALSGKNKDKQSDFIAATVLAQDQAFLRARQAGAPLSQGLLQHTLDTSLTNVQGKYAFTSPEVFKAAATKIKKTFDDINAAENKAAYGSSFNKKNNFERYEASPEDINFTAKKYGLTPEQVRQRIKSGGG
jgi:hypothetical protein